MQKKELFKKERRSVFLQGNFHFFIADFECNLSLSHMSLVAFHLYPDIYNDTDFDTDT